jgi:chromosome segregation protein
MPLKTLELTGYKTFASKTTFDFAGTITAIVGPNGSGKSNIADALRWVLGEQSYSLLRGKKTVDMIFSGSEHRPRAGMASATIVFDNASGWLPIDFSEVALTRRAYRDGQNEYLLNGQRVRLRDVSELLGRGGLAGHTYTIIGQGLVDAALSLKADERRKLFEEAAGIGVYRARKEETLRRLDSTRRNLERVHDILAELTPRLRSLERQSRRVQEYEQVKDDLHLLLRDWYGYHWHHAQRALMEARDYARRYEADLQHSRAAQGKFDQQITALREHIHHLRARLAAWHRELGQLHTRRERLSREIAVAEERQRALTERGRALQLDQARLREELHLLEERRQRAAAELDRLEKQAGDAGEQRRLVQLALHGRAQERSAIEHRLQENETSLARLNTQLAQADAQRAELQRRRAALAARRAEMQPNLAAAENTLQTSQSALDRADRLLAERARRALAARTENQTARRALAQLETARQQITTAQAASRADHARLAAQLEVLQQAEQAHAGYSTGARAILQQPGDIPGVIAALGSRLEVPAELETAIAAALGHFLDAVLLRHAAALPAALQALAAAAANGALLPLDQLDPPAPLAAPDDPDCLGVAASLVAAEPLLRPAVDLLLGQVLIVRDWQAAERLRTRLPAATLVTLHGETRAPGGASSLGGRGGSGVIARPRQKREILAQQASLESALAELAGRLLQSDTSLESARLQLGGSEEQLESALAAEDEARENQRAAAAHTAQAAAQLDWQRAQLAQLDAEDADTQRALAAAADSRAQTAAQGESAAQAARAARAELLALPLDELQTQAAHWGTQFAVGERAAADARLRLDERAQALADGRVRLRQLETQAAELASELAGLRAEEARLRAEESDLGGQVQDLQALVDPAETELAGQEAAQDGMQGDDAASRHALALAERNHAQAQIALARRQEALDSLRQRIEDDFGLVAFEYVEDMAGPTPLPLGDIVESLPLVNELPPELGETIKRQRAQLRRMGAINPDAHQEFLEVNNRHKFLTAQIEDLAQAEKDMLEVIGELDLIMEREFRATFENVAREFRETFTRLFGGGSARLLLTDPDDLTASGVDIEARLPGRRAQGLSLLSGGERSLTAAALVFSLIKVSPAPFCVLDEVDAMLDEANVNRFADLLRELSQKTQFIIITHNRNTVQVADTIYGITMGRDSASQVLGLKLDQVAEAVRG